MGTRADFYVGRGKDAEWIGSIAWDGYWDGIDPQILQCTSEAAFRHAVQSFLLKRDDATLPTQGWPWPWNDSSITDCAYAFDAGYAWQEAASHWVRADKEYDDGAGLPEDAIRCVWPDMAARKNVALGERSGAMIFVGR